MTEFDDYLGIIKDSESIFDEIPVSVDEFVTSEEYLGQPPLSENQYKIIRAGTQIYRLDTLIDLYGEEEGHKRYEQTFNELILCLGKASGKDLMSMLICTYIVYLLLCLKDPQKYYGKPPGDNIDIMNIAINAKQANRVFFKGVVEKVKRCPWFAGKAYIKQGEIEFDKNINVISGHSEAESLEGYNCLVCVLDEISGFAMESPTTDLNKTSHSIYKMHRASVDSRFADFGKVILLSFPRFAGDYISQRYDAVIAEKEVVIKSHEFKLDPDLPDGISENEFQISWEEDHIIRYKYPHVFALRRPTWDMNPTVNIDSPAMVRAFAENPADALGRFAAQPSDNVDSSFFKNKTAIDNAFSATNGVDESGVFWTGFEPEEDKEYFVHVDLAIRHDNCAVGIGHVDNWVKIPISNGVFETHPHVKIDAVRWWTPGDHRALDFAEVRDYIVSLRRRGFNIKLCTFDRWNSVDTMNYLTNEQGIRTDTLSVGNKHYDDFLSVLYDGRLVGPAIPLLVDELKQLRYIKNKVDHPAKSSKDLSDATCGVIYNCIKHTHPPVDNEIEIHTYDPDFLRDRRKEEAARNVINPPKREAPEELQNYLSRLRSI